MKRITLLIIFAVIYCLHSGGAEKIKVACIGNSITTNGALPFEDKYPTILQNLLGDDYDVRNFGVAGATMLKKGVNSYWTQENYTTALNFNPDIVIIKLGTNDSRTDSWKYKDDFIQDYTDFIQSFRSINENVKVYVCYPLPAWSNNQYIRGDIINNEIIPQIKTVADISGATIIDLNTPISGKMYCLYDFVHPDARGTSIIATVIYRTLVSGGKTDIELKTASIVSSFDRTDKSVKVTTSVGNDKSDELFDNDLQTEFSFIPFSKEAWIEIELSEEFRLTGYTLTVGSDNIINTPKNWIVEGSLDGGNWQRVDTKDNQQFTFPSETSMYEIPVVNNNQSSVTKLPVYKFYRITFTDNHGGENLNIAELQLFGHNINQTTSVTGNGGTLSVQYEGLNLGGNLDERSINLITNLMEKNYCIRGKKTGWIQYKSIKPVTVNSYSITCGIANKEKNPKSWELLGSTDGENWSLLNKQENQDFIMRLNTMEYNVINDNEYSYFRLNVTENNGGNDLQICKWQLFEGNYSSGIENYDGINNTSVCAYRKAIHIQASVNLKYEIYNAQGYLIDNGCCDGNKTVTFSSSGLYIVRTIGEKAETFKVLVK